MIVFILSFLILSYIFCANMVTPLLASSNDDKEETYQNYQPTKWGNVFSRISNEGSFGKSYALIIGVGNYDKSWPKLEAPYYDAIRMADFLINVQYFDYVVTLTNQKATKHEINRLMEEVFPNLLGKSDRFLFYYSGHGTQRMIGDIPMGYLPLHDSGPEAYGSMISMDEIERWDRIIRQTKHVLFVLDCCFSGLAGQQRKSPLTDKRITRLSRYAHHLIKAGTKNEEAMASLSRWGGSLFTDSIIKGASGLADMNDKDGLISLKELMKYVEDRTDAELLKLESVDDFLCLQNRCWCGFAAENS